jgi:hypothetical protein
MVLDEAAGARGRSATPAARPGLLATEALGAGTVSSADMATNTIFQRSTDLLQPDFDAPVVRV